MFLIKVILLGIVSCASGASVDLDSGNLQAIVIEAVRDILHGGLAGENVRASTLLKEIELLKNQSLHLEQKINFLEEENRDDDICICSLQANMESLVEMISRNNSVNALNLTEMMSNELTEKCRKFGEQTSEIESVVRTNRNIVSPRNIAFCAVLTNSLRNMVPGQAVKFDHVLLNERAVYNPYTGAFTAPVSGTYLFTFHFDVSVHTFIRLDVDGVNIVDAVANPHINPRDYHDKESMSGNTVIIHVGIGQSILVEVYDVTGEAASSNKYRLSTFSGVLLFPEDTPN